MDLDLGSGLVASVAAGGVSAFGWMISKLFSLYRHEIKDMKQATHANTSALVEAMHDFKDHMRRDEEVQLGMLSELKEMKGYIHGVTGDNPSR